MNEWILCLNIYIYMIDTVESHFSSWNAALRDLIISLHVQHSVHITEYHFQSHIYIVISSRLFPHLLAIIDLFYCFEMTLHRNDSKRFRQLISVQRNRINSNLLTTKLYHWQFMLWVKIVRFQFIKSQYIDCV